MKIKDNYEFVLEDLLRFDDTQCVLTASEFLSYKLGYLLFQSLSGSENFKKRLLSYPEPLSSFSSRIKISYALGYISVDVFNGLNIVRKIRNTFAHDFDSVTFNRKDVGRYIGSIVGLFRGIPGDSNKKRFVNAIGIVVGELFFHYHRELLESGELFHSTTSNWHGIVTKERFRNETKIGPEPINIDIKIEHLPLPYTFGLSSKN